MNGEEAMSTQGNTEPKPNNPPSKPKANTNKQKSGGPLLGFFVFLTFLLAVAGIGAGYYVWQQTQQQLNAAEVERQALEHALGNLNENPRMQKLTRNLNKKIDDVNSKYSKLHKDLNDVISEQERIASIAQNTSETLQRGRKAWMLKEVEHVLRMAQHRLLLDRDFKGALAGLKAADQRLNEIDDVRLIPVRKSIAKQTRTLNQFPHPDYTGIQLQLDNTIDRLKTGLLKQAVESQQPANASTKEEVITQADAATEQQTKPFTAQQIWEMIKKFANDTSQKVKAALSESVNITHGEQKIALFIEQQEKKRAYDFLRNKLLGAKYSVSARNDDAYHQQLNAALAWLEHNDQFTNREVLAKEIRELNKINLLPALPDISEPSAQLTKYMDILEE